MKLYKTREFCIFFLLIILFCGCNRNKKQALQFLGFSAVKEILTPINEEENWNFNPGGDGQQLVIFSFKPKDSLAIVHECQKNDLKRLPMVAADLPDGAIFNLIDSANREGYYKLKIDDEDQMSYSVAVIDLKKKKIVVYSVFY